MKHGNLSHGVTAHESGSIPGIISGNEGERFLAMEEYLRRLIEKYKPGCVIFPEYRNSKNADAAKASLGLRAILLRLCFLKEIPCQAISEMSYRKSMGVDLTKKLTPEEEQDYSRRLGKRTAKTKGKTKPKRDMKARVAKALKAIGVEAKDDDEADALLILIEHGRRYAKG